ncbi:MAG: CopG family transcriptional regulator [Puniceicoccaceae bacterium]|nr:MAG: CopG family transcriptional regulator [Puniceicoccaceae bacterium]
MATQKVSESSPLTFDLTSDLFSTLAAYQQKLGIKSKSEVIRFAIANYNYGSFRSDAKQHRQISVRLPLKQKNALVRLAKQKKVSIGELLRAALESLPANPADLDTATQTSIVEAMKKKPAKKAAKKTVKKAAKKAAAKKAPAKKAAKKTVKKAAKKAAVKKAAVKKAPARKAAKKAAKKATKKVAKKAARKSSRK